MVSVPVGVDIHIYSKQILLIWGLVATSEKVKMKAVMVQVLPK